MTWGRVGFGWLLLVCALWVHGIAVAGADGHGAAPWPSDGAPTQPLWGLAPSVQEAGSGSAGVIVEAARAPLVLRQSIGGQVDERVLVGDLLALNLGGSFALSRRVGLGATLPVFALAGPELGARPPALGDLIVVAPIGVVLPRPDGTGFGVSLSPIVRAPTGAVERYLGDGALGVGGRVALGGGVGRLRLSASGGVDYRTLLDPLREGRRGVLGAAGLAAVWSLGPRLALHLEGRATVPGLAGGTPPVEVLLGARGRQASGLWWSAGLAGALTDGAGGSAVRLLVGIGYGTSARGVPEVAPPAGVAERPALPAVVPALVRVRVQDTSGRVPGGATVTFDGASGREVHEVGAEGLVETWLAPGAWRVEIIADDFGRQVRGLVIAPEARTARVEAILLPAAGDATLALAVLDPGGAPVEGVRARLGGVPVGTLGAAGTLELWGLAPGAHTLSLVAEGFEDHVVTLPELSEGPNAVALTLRREPGAVLLIARGPDGPVRDAVARFDGPSRLPPLALGGDGRRIVQVRPGAWSVLVLSPTWGMQKHAIVVPEDSAALTVVEVLLRPDEGGGAELTARVVDPDGAPIADAEIWLDGEQVGRTASGGAITLGGLAEGPRTLAVRGAWLDEGTPEEVFLVTGAQERRVTARWRQGVVRVRARASGGDVDDAVARFSGRGGAQTLALGPHGDAMIALAPGSWDALVVSEDWGLQGRALRVPEDGGRRLALDVVFGGLPGGDADLTVRVVDAEGLPVEGAAVAVDGYAVGATATEGTLTLRGIGGGRRRVSVTSALHRPGGAALALAAGPNAVEIPLGWAPGVVRLRAVGPDGAIPDAVVRLAGPGPAPTVHLGPLGERHVALAPGAWTALASSTTWGLREERFMLTDDGAVPREVRFTFRGEPADDATLLVRVEDPEGGPVSGARVARGGETLATTLGGGAALIRELPVGDVELDVTAPGFAPAVLGATLLPGATEQVVRLAWIPRALRVEVVDEAGAPVRATIGVDGPAEVDSVTTDPGGAATLRLRPGTWRVIADGGPLGTASAPVRVPRDGALADVRFTLGGSLVDVTDAEVRIREQVPFDFNQDVPRPEAAGLLDQVAAALLGRPDLGRVEVQGHTDDVGGAAYNLDLSQRRAEAVRDALVARGVAPERLVARGYGFTRPIAANDSDAGRATNRRVQFDVLERAAD